jgi:hypothetical protein
MILVAPSKCLFVNEFALQCVKIGLLGHHKTIGPMKNKYAQTLD